MTPIFWQALLADGVKLEPPPKGLLATRLHNATVRDLRAIRDYFDECQADLLRRLEGSIDTALLSAIN